MGNYLMNCAEKNRAESWPKNGHQSSPPVGLYIYVTSQVLTLVAFV